MLLLTNIDGSRCRRWFAVMILFAVCALTASVTTRYTFPGGESNGAVASIQKHRAPEPGRQRLIESAATWIAPVVSSFLLQTPTRYPRVAPVGPLTSSVLFDKSLYNRPPPSSEFLS